MKGGGDVERVPPAELNKRGGVRSAGPIFADSIVTRKSPSLLSSARDQAHTE